MFLPAADLSSPATITQTFVPALVGMVLLHELAAMDRRRAGAASLSILCASCAIKNAQFATAASRSIFLQNMRMFASWCGKAAAGRRRYEERYEEFS